MIDKLISTMNIDKKEKVEELLNKMNIKKNSVIINQCPNCNELIDIENDNYKIYSFNEKGLSRSRNKAIQQASSEICIICDDDMKYDDNLDEIVENAYREYPEYDIIAFYIENVKSRDIIKKGRVGYIKSLRICSVQISFKRTSILENNIIFDEEYGAGSGKFDFGEENIFLWDCLRKGLKIMYYPIKIGTLTNERESTWFKGYNKNNFISRGAFFYRMSNNSFIANILNIQFAIRKHKLYKNTTSFIFAIKNMNLGKKKVKDSKILFIGDFELNTGPANVNKNIKKSLGNKASYSKKGNKIFRVIDMLVKMCFCKKICFCSFSKIDVYGIKFAKILKRKTFYLMHGHVKQEQSLNNVHNKKSIKIEKYILENVDKVICVSKMFMEYMEKQNYNAKFDYVFNGIDFDEIKITEKIDRNPLQIMSTGGDKVQKNNYIICESIQKIRNQTNLDIKYIIVGNFLERKDEFLKYDFVEIYENLSHKDCLIKMAESRLYIQNSTFETFGLAVIEALYLGCDLLISYNIGALGVIENINENDIINDNNDIEEISKKILNKMYKKNEIRFDKEKCSYNNRGEELLRIIKEE